VGSQGAHHYSIDDIIFLSLNCLHFLKTICCESNQEIGTLPRGPAETIETWYAGSRLAYAVCSVKLWGRNYEMPHWLTYCSRVLEKGVDYSMSIFKHAINEINWDGVSEIVCWSDCGRHFQANKAIATMACRIVTEKRISVTIKFGLGKHFKNPCDGHFSAHALNEHLLIQRELMPQLFAQCVPMTSALHLRELC